MVKSFLRNLCHKWQFQLLEEKPVAWDQQGRNLLIQEERNSNHATICFKILHFPNIIFLFLISVASWILWKGIYSHLSRLWFLLWILEWQGGLLDTLFKRRRLGIWSQRRYEGNVRFRLFSIWHSIILRLWKWEIVYNQCKFKLEVIFWQFYLRYKSILILNLIKIFLIQKCFGSTAIVSATIYRFVSKENIIYEQISIHKTNEANNCIIKIT